MPSHLQNEPDFLALCGLPCSGKSTLARILTERGFHHERYDQHIQSSDPSRNIDLPQLILAHLRTQIGNRSPTDEEIEWAAAEVQGTLFLETPVSTMVQMWRHGIRVLFDTHLETVANRQVFREFLAEGNGGISITPSLVWIDTPLEVCMKRLQARNAKEARHYPMPPQIILQMSQRFQTPHPSEGFKRIIRIRPEDDALVKLAQAGVDISACAADIGCRRLALAKILGEQQRSKLAIQP